jgi:pilus assembly protein CpaE
MSESENPPEGRKVRLPVAIKVLVCSSSEHVIDTTLDVLKSLASVSVEVVRDGASALGHDLIFHHKPDVLIVDVRLDNLSDLERLSTIAQQADQPIYVMATSRESDVEGIRRLMRLGISDFLPQPINTDELILGLQNAARKVRMRKPLPGSHIITFLHGSGGAGATTLAVNAAACLKAANKDNNVCVLDMDVQFGQVALNLDLSNARGILDVIEAPERLDATFLEGLMAHHESGIDVLSAPDVLLSLDSFSPEFAGRLLNIAMELYDFIVVDMPIALTNWSQTILGRTSVVVLVGQLTVPGIRQLRRLVSIMAADGAGDLDMLVVLNRYLGGWKGSIQPDEAGKALGRPIDFLVANDYKTVSAAVDRGILLSEISGRARIVKDVEKLAQGILNKISVVQ